jgi:hypothetical protein
MIKISITIILLIINLFSCATSEFSNPKFNNNLPSKIPYANNLPEPSPSYYVRSQPMLNQNFYSTTYSDPYIIPQLYYPNYDIDKYYVLPIKYIHPN